MGRPRHVGIWTGAAGALALGAMSGVFAADPPPSAAPSKELRENMALLHERMAACLRSDQAVSECHAAMMRDCQTGIGAQGCAMMGLMRGGGMGRGMKHGDRLRMQSQQPDTAPKP